MNSHDLLQILWDDYCQISPQAQAIKDLLSQQQDELINDHIALRTIDDPACGITQMAQIFLDLGYVFAADVYTFALKHLRARYLIHADHRLPKVFISELCLADCEPVVAEILRPLLRAHPPQLSQPGRPWVCAVADYERLAAHSEYAAWLLAFGWRANHFTVSVNHLQHYANLEQLLEQVQAAGFSMNQSGGLIKGSAAEGLRQAATLATPVTVQMSSESHGGVDANAHTTPINKQLPGCYVEFAERFPRLDDGQLYQGFLANSADKIFESTDRQ